MNKSHLKVLIHIAFWIGWVLFFNKITVFEIIEDIEMLSQEGTSNIISKEKINAFPLIVIGVFIKMLVAYFIIYMYSKKVSKTKAIFALVSIGAFIIIFFFEYYIDTYYIAQSETYDTVHLELWSNSNMLQYIILIIVVTMFLIVSEWSKIDKKLLTLEKEKLQSELLFLKYQINPHLLFNTLNNLFSMSQEAGIEDVSSGISKLSGLMRFMLYESTENEIPIAKEIDFIEKFIDLQKIRVVDETQLIVNFNKKGNFKGTRIRPFLLIPFVENAFKHGVNLRTKSNIDIDLEIHKETLNFKVSNLIFRVKKDFTDNEGGIGLDNLKKRLDLLYPDKHSLKLEENGSIFNAHLTINLT